MDSWHDMARFPIREKLARFPNIDSGRPMEKPCGAHDLPGKINDWWVFHIWACAKLQGDGFIFVGRCMSTPTKRWKIDRHDSMGRGCLIFLGALIARHPRLHRNGCSNCFKGHVLFRTSQQHPMMTMHSRSTTRFGTTDANLWQSDMAMENNYIHHISSHIIYRWSSHWNILKPPFFLGDVLLPCLIRGKTSSHPIEFPSLRVTSFNWSATRLQSPPNVGSPQLLSSGDFSWRSTGNFS